MRYLLFLSFLFIKSSTYSVFSEMVLRNLLLEIKFWTFHMRFSVTPTPVLHWYHFCEKRRYGWHYGKRCLIPCIYNKIWCKVYLSIWWCNKYCKFFYSCLEICPLYQWYINRSKIIEKNLGNWKIYRYLLTFIKCMMM